MHRLQRDFVKRRQCIATKSAVDVGHRAFRVLYCDQRNRGTPAMSAKVVQLRQDGNERNATSGRLPNNVYRIREHLTESEVAKLLAALKRIAMDIAIG